MLLGRCFPVLGIPGKFGYNQIYFRRALLLIFLRNVFDSAENEPKGNDGKYIYIGYKIDDITNPKKVPLNNDYWWKRQILVIDRYCQNSWWRTIWDSTIARFWGAIKDNSIGMLKVFDRTVWKDLDYEGKILFSDKEDTTLSFEGEGLHKETDANQGNMAHLKWMLRDL